LWAVLITEWQVLNIADKSVWSPGIVGSYEYNKLAVDKGI